MTTLILFFFAILYAICFQLTEKTNAFENEDELKNDINKVDLSELFLIKVSLKLDFNILNFEQQCHRVNQILNKWNFFLKVYKLKEKFQSLVKQNPNKKNIVRELSGCITDKYKGFNIVRLEQPKKFYKNLFQSKLFTNLLKIARKLSVAISVIR